jgi:thiosulfate reductase cytochrome b subunit
VKGRVVGKSDSGLAFEREKDKSGAYFPGPSRRSVVNIIGIVSFLLVIGIVAIHGGARILSAKRRPKPEMKLDKVYMYTAYERLWHWFMALSVAILLLTGYEVHNAGRSVFLGFPLAVSVHNIFAALLAINAFLALFYHLASAAIRQFIPRSENLRNDLIDQAFYYLRGIFHGHPHPVRKTPDRKLNPLQQITYLLLLNVLFPLQIITGLAIWGIEWWPDIAGAVGGLKIIAPLHLLGSWLFLSFLILHLYLTTTGHTTFSNIKAMIDGYDVAEVAHSKEGESNV